MWSLITPNVFPHITARFKGSLPPSKNENELDKDLCCTLHKFGLICVIKTNKGHRDSKMHEFSSSVNKVNKAAAKVRAIGDRLPLSLFDVNVKLCMEIQ